MFKIHLPQIFIMLIILLMLAFNLNYPKWTDGDEPHYLGITQSLVTDKDMDMTNQQANKTFLDYRPDPTLVLHATTDLSGKLRSVHSIGNSLVYVPSFYIAKELLNQNNMIVKLARITQFLIFLVGFFIIYLVATRFASNFNLLVFLPWLISPTIFIYSTVLFSDVLQGVCFLITALGLIYLNNDNKEFELNRNWLMFSGFIAGFNVYVHFKTLLTTTLMISAFFIFSFLKNKKIILNKNIFYFVIPFILFVISHMVMTLNWYGTISFSSIQAFTAQQGYNKSIFNLLSISPLIGFTGQILDIDKGIFWMSPTVIFYLFGFKDWFLKNRFSFFVVALPSIISIIIYSCYNEWAGGFAPASRLLIPFMFVLFPSYYFTFVKFYKNLFGKIFISFSILISFLILLSFKFGFNRGGFPSIQNINLHYITISRMLKIPDLNLILNFLNFDLKPVFSIQGLIGIIFFTILSTQFFQIVNYKLFER